MTTFIKKIMEDKKEYRRQMARVDAMPTDYQFVFKKIQTYMWNFAGGSGHDMVKTQYDLIDLFQHGADTNKDVLEITGNDVAGFCDDLIRDNKLWTDHLRQKLNEDLKKSN